MKHSGFGHFLHHVKYIFGVWIVTNFIPWPVEHWLWEKAPVLRQITEAFGL